MGLVSIDISGGVAVVGIDSPPVNALSHAVRQELEQAALHYDRSGSTSLALATSTKRARRPASLRTRRRPSPVIR